MKTTTEELGLVMNKIIDKLDNDWIGCKNIFVRYRNTKFPWVRIPKPTEEGMETYSTLKWDLEVYEYYTIN
jgi:hypothetical protein